MALVDAQGRENRSPPKLSVKVTPNKPPKLKLDLARDARVSPLEEFLVKATASDDYGLRKFGISYTLASAESTDIVLSESIPRGEKTEAEHMLDFEALEAEPDQLLSYYFWAEDSDAKGETRRTFGDMFFTEVRHFEEIFRQGEQPPNGQEQQQQQQQEQQQQSQNEQNAEQLAEVQKQIINATWNVMRRGNGDEQKFRDDVSVILESQQAAAEQAAEMSQQLEDAESRDHMLRVQEKMQEAISNLTNAFSDPSSDALANAIGPERGAYEALLKLRAREHEVIQQQQQQQQQGQQSQSQSQQRMQQQLNQLELQNDENRYETQRQAQEEEDQAQTEMRRALNQLKELAQRQEDLNEQLQELQTALEQAETEEERNEIERQLKRLREQQEEMLRDTDELMDRMEEAQDQEAMQNAQEQLEQTREQMRETSESLDEGEVTPALASGTRAQRELEEMREELRKESANQFTEQMREMRDEARQLEERQNELSEQLQGDAAANEEESGGGLRDDDQPSTEETRELRDELLQQRERLNELLEEMKETVQEAEESEPLLAEGLYDAFREAEKEQLAEKIEATAQLTERGLNEQAQQLDENVREGISELREEIDQAADRVLGDQTEALRLAIQTLKDLERELQSEMDQFGEGSEAEPSEQGQPAEREEPSEQDEQEGDSEQQESNSDRQPGDRQEQEDSERQQQEGQQPGEGQPREGEPPQDQNQQQPGQGQQNQEQQQPREGQPGQGQGQPNENQNEQQQEQQQQSENQSPGQQQGGRNPSEQQNENQQRTGRPQGQERRNSNAGNPSGNWDQPLAAPITGDDFREWSDRLRDVEEIVDDPELRAEAARIREEARNFRRDFVRHSEEPKWELIEELVTNPLKGLRQEVSAELMRRAAEKNAIVPIDKDPVPQQFTEQVRRYYENLGSSE